MEKAIIAKWRRAKEGMFYDGMLETEDTAILLGEIDRIIYSVYGLTEEERDQVERLMGSEKRPS